MEISEVVRGDDHERAVIQTRAIELLHEPVEKPVHVRDLKKVSLISLLDQPGVPSPRVFRRGPAVDARELVLKAGGKESPGRMGEQHVNEVERPIRAVVTQLVDEAIELAQRVSRRAFDLLLDV